MIKYDLKNKNFILINNCDVNIKHDSCNFEYFYNKFLNNDLTYFNMNIKKFQQYYIRSLFKSNQSNDINLVKSIFKKNFNLKFELNNGEISKEKFLVIGNINKSNIIDISHHRTALL